jgi:hypothetical protein
LIPASLLDGLAGRVQHGFADHSGREEEEQMNRFVVGMCAALTLVSGSVIAMQAAQAANAARK